MFISLFFIFHITITGLTKQKQTIYSQGNVFWLIDNIQKTKLPNCQSPPSLGHLTVEGVHLFLCVCEWSAGDYSSNDNSTYGDWINLPEHWDHKSNLRMIILLPDEELISNVLQWSEREDVFVVVWYWGGACLPTRDKTDRQDEFVFMLYFFLFPPTFFKGFF